MTESEQAKLLDFIQKLQRERGEEETITSARTPSILKNKLLEKMAAYKLPWGSVTDYHQYERLMTSKMRRVANDKKAAYEARGWLFNDTTLEDLKGEKKSICEDKDITRGWDFAQKCWFQQPIVYQKEIDLSKFQSEIEYFGDSNLISLPGTLEKLLDASMKKGLDFPLLSELLFSFIAKHFGDLLTAAYQYRSNDDPHKLFSLLVERIDLNEEKAKIEKARRAICRKPEDHISETMNKLKSLAAQLLLITSPHLSLDQRQKKAGSIALLDLESFVTDKTWKKFQEFSSQRLANGQWTDFVSAIRFIAKVESEKDMKITSTKCSKASFDPSMVVNAAGEDNIAINNINKHKGDERKPRDRNRKPFRDRRGPTTRSSSQFSSGRSTTPGSSGSRYGSRTSSNNSYKSDRNSSSERNKYQSSSFKYNPTETKGKPEYKKFDKESSPKSYDRKKLIDVKSLKDRCYKCYSPSHRQRQCPRYFQESKTYCKFCAKKYGTKLWHSEQYCRFSKSQYRTPSRDTKEKRLARGKRDNHLN